MDTLKLGSEKSLEEVEGLREKAGRPLEGAFANHETTCGMVKIPVKVGHHERAIELKLGTSTAAILAIVAEKHGCLVEELFLFRDGMDEPLAEVIIVDENYPHHHRHHVHFKGLVRVTVNYDTGTKAHEFKRQATIEDVLEWAIKAFGIDPSLASEFDLADHGSKVALPSGEHIGHLAQRHDELALDLIRGDISNG
jgi:hypothetical protein